MIISADKQYHCEKSVVVLGMFDGVHIGHRVLLEKGKALSRQKKLPLIVCTFQQHPLSLIAPDRAPKLLTSPEERASLMEEMGVDVLVAQPFCAEVMNTPPEDYIGQLVQRFHPTDVICGYNHTFGKMGAGTPALLEGVGAALGFRTWIVPKITLDGEEVSSTAVRAMLEEGNVARAMQMLKRPYCLRFAGENGILRCAEPEKQPLPAGKYRVLVENEGKTLPASLTLRENGCALCRPEIREGNVLFLSRLNGEKA